MIKHCVAILLVSVLFVSCTKNTVSKIPHITLEEFYPGDSMKVNIDTTYVLFKFTDGDGDIGSSDNASVIHLKDSRYDTGYAILPFPDIDQSIEDPKKGLTGECQFFPYPQPVPRLDSLHFANGDTLTFEFYITDRAHNESNHIVTKRLIIKP